MEKRDKIWGLYTTYSNPEDIEKLSEVDTWRMIENLGGAIFWANHDYDKPWQKNTTIKDVIDAEYNLEFLVYSTKRFGVEFSNEPSAEEHIERSPSYNTWYLFWKNHFESMDQQVYDQFVKDKCDGKDISKYLPEGNWKENLENPIQKKKIDK